MTFGEKLQRLRAREGLSQDALAELLNVSRQAVSRWERDETMPETEKVIRISDHFHVTTDYLLKDGLLKDGPEQFPPASRPLPEPGSLWDKYGFVVGYLLAALGFPWILLALINLFDRNIWPTGMGLLLSLVGRGGFFAVTGLLLARRWRRAGRFRRQDLGWALICGGGLLVFAHLLTILIDWTLKASWFPDDLQNAPLALIPLLLGLLLALLTPRRPREPKTE